MTTELQKSYMEKYMKNKITITVHRSLHEKLTDLKDEDETYQSLLERILYTIEQNDLKIITKEILEN